MFQKRFFYYFVSVFCVLVLYWGIENSHNIFPTLVEKFNKKDSLCILVPSLASSGRLKERFANRDFELIFKTYAADSELQTHLTTADCDIFIFPSKNLSLFSRTRLVQFQKTDVDLSKISPDFLGLKFDRLNQFFIPLAYWIESNDVDKKTSVNILLATVFNTVPNLELMRDVLRDLLSPDVQKVFFEENKLITVLRDSEIDLPVKSSEIRKHSLNHAIVVQ